MHTPSWLLSVFCAAILSAAAGGHARAQGAAEAWGFNVYGQLGNGTSGNTSAVPVTVSTFSSDVTTVAAGDNHSLAIFDGGAYAWGDNANGQLGNGTTTNSSVPVAIGSLSSGVTAVAGGALYSLAIRNGSAYAWGNNDTGKLGNGTNTSSSVPVAVSGLAGGVTVVAAGSNDGLAIQNGALYAWGYNGNGELGNGTTTASNTPVAVSNLNGGVTAVAAGGAHNLAVQNGALFAWGNDGLGQLGNGTVANYIATPVALSLTTGVTSIAAGSAHSLAVQNGQVFAWGANSSGELGNGTTTNSSTPIEIDAINLKNIVMVAAGLDSSYALSRDGSLWVWGDNDVGQLGLGTSTSQYDTPQQLLPPPGYAYTDIDADAGGLHAVATLSSVPEPAAWMPLVLGAGGLGLCFRRQRRHLLSGQHR